MDRDIELPYEQHRNDPPQDVVKALVAHGWTPEAVKALWDPDSLRATPRECTSETPCEECEARNA
jgi:hypothetical protein